MKQMKTHENAASLLFAVISAIITMVAGTALSVLLDGFVQGFLALTAIGLVFVLAIAWRRHLSLELQFRRGFPELKLVDRPQTAGGKGATRSD
jgi:hypothetical protein